jgi:hypothetical protein
MQTLMQLKQHGKELLMQQETGKMLIDTDDFGFDPLENSTLGTHSLRFSWAAASRSSSSSLSSNPHSRPMRISCSASSWGGIGVHSTSESAEEAVLEDFEVPESALASLFFF